MKAFLTRLASLVIYLLPVGIFTCLVMGPWGARFQPKNIRATLFIGAALLGMLMIQWRRSKTGWLAGLALSLLVYGAAYKALTFIPDVSAYPWSLGWSESSRYYYASLFFSEPVYGVSVPPSVLHPTRYLMQSLPFIIPDAPLWLHRLWQVLLWLGLNLWAGAVIARRFRAGWELALFSFLFLFQGPVYYHLLVMVVLVVWGFDSHRFGRSLFVVLLASVWAGLSRVNWFPMPALMASVLYFMEAPIGKQPIWRYLLPVVAWGVFGTLTAFLAQNAYILLSGNPAMLFSSSFSSDLLWYRLWPNATYGPGILRSVWRASFPLLLLILARWLPDWRRYHPMRLLGIGAAVCLVLAGGIVVSVKIGGGSNLHNVDAYLVLLLLVGAGLYYHQAQPEPVASENGISQPLRAQSALWPLVFFVLLFPIRDLTQTGAPLPQRDEVTANQEVEVLSAAVQQEAQAGGEILFIDQRHLLTTHQIKNVPLVPDYEVVFLMEMVMSNNQPYLERFHQELKEKQFAMIVMGTPAVHYQDQSNAFAEENNKWVDQVAAPLLCYYQPTLTLPDSGMSILTPRDQPCD